MLLQRAQETLKQLRTTVLRLNRPSIELLEQLARFHTKFLCPFWTARERRKRGANALYGLEMSYNRGLDPDKDGIACEKA